MSSINAILVEDNRHELENLVYKLKKYCPQVTIVGQCTSGEEAIKAIHKLNPDLVFLDIDLGSMRGFDVLQKVEHVNFSVIFTTGYDDQVLEAVNSKTNTIAYLVKPFDQKDLSAAVMKAWEQTIQRTPKTDRLALTVGHQLFLIDVEDIVYCESDDNHTRFHLVERDKYLTIKKTLGHFERKLPISNFFRSHRSYLISRNYLESYTRSDGGFTTMKWDNKSKKLSVSPEKRELLNSWLRQ